jgi:hypothetical protein
MFLVKQAIWGIAHAQTRMIPKYLTWFVISPLYHYIPATSHITICHHIPLNWSPKSPWNISITMYNALIVGYGSHKISPENFPHGSPARFEGGPQGSCPTLQSPLLLRPLQQVASAGRPGFAQAHPLKDKI